MEESIRVYEVDAFTNERGLGNPAGVVPNANGLSEATMQEIAKTLGHSETAFIFDADGDDHDFRIRFFTPEVEVPLCGHATIAANYVRAVEQGIEDTRTVLQKCTVGILPIQIIPNSDGFKIVMTHDEVKLGDAIDVQERAPILAALGLTEADLDPRCPVQIATNGPKAIVGIKDRSKLNSLSPDMEAVKALKESMGCNGVFVFTFDSEDPSILTDSRYFAPAIGVKEDPVTGTGHGPLGHYLVANNLVEHDGKNFTFIGRQGEAISRTGHAEVSVDIDRGKISKITVAGNAVISSSREMSIS